MNQHTQRREDDMTRDASLREALILVLARADGQIWDSLPDAPTRAEFMGYPQMADAAIDWLSNSEVPDLIQELAADKDLAHGDYRDFTDIKAALDWLDDQSDTP